MAKPKSNGEHRIEYVPLSQLKRAKVNPKEHDLPLIIASMREHGVTQPMAEDARTGRLYAGHGRMEALAALWKEDADKPPRGVRKEGDDWLVPVLRGVEFKDDAAAERYLLLDNRATELGGWDHVKLAPMLAKIAADGKDALASVGFAGPEFLEAMGQLANPQVESSRDTHERLVGLTYSVVVTCKDEDEQTALLERLEGEGLKCKPMVT